VSVPHNRENTNKGHCLCFYMMGETTKDHTESAVVCDICGEQFDSTETAKEHVHNIGLLN
jgi:hypothetical protein